MNSNFAFLAQSYDSFLFDCDGVLWHGNEAIEGSFDALRYLLGINKQIFLLTNASARSRQ